MRDSDSYRKARIEACRKFYLQNEGRHHSQIERDMRAAGFPDFHRRSLYPRGSDPGWVEKYEWDRELCFESRLQPAPRNQKPPKGGTHTLQPPLHKPERKQGLNMGLSTSQNRLRERAASSIEDLHRRAAESPRKRENTKHSQESQDSLDSLAFPEWLKAISPPMFKWDAPHLKLLIDKLRLITEGKKKRLMIFMPPRHGKSELVSTRYSAWRLITNPALKIILASYNQGLANRFSRSIRNVIADHHSQKRVTELRSYEVEEARELAEAGA